MATFLYEILIRGNADGTLRGAHQILGQISATGAESIGPPQPLDPAIVGTLLGTAFVGFANAPVAVPASFTGIVPTPSPAATDAQNLAQAKVSANAAIIAFANSITDKIASAYPRAEVESWPSQLFEARAIVAGTSLPPGSLLPLMAANAAGVAVADVPAAALLALAQKVIKKSASYNTIIATVQLLRLQGEAAIAAAATTNGLAAAMAALKAKGTAAAHALGLI